ncbi:GyrI-like domain-containing protein [Sediminicola luteus]|uniref:GyrI-like small molecule binding domain-containing protein n=1 Tax=Sediminicola luteus TaxID=319238 RepID=A0A2A4GFA6_9FLAO|nr:GyrI-like domain-containing protein [Sediminicola luteus]PCE66465.1 hypothetical protein B7P33_03990 [Sediminicola luteus]
MKHEWRKKEKSLYLPKAKPEWVSLPAMRFLSISGEGSPESPAFSETIQALFAASYAVKMSLKKEKHPPMGYSDYTVYPLEGVWSLHETAQKTFTGKVNKNDLVYTLMIRQPDFVPEEYLRTKIAETIERKSIPFLELLKVEQITEGPCVQMLHLGPFETEAKSFAQMEAFTETQGLIRKYKWHREIYLSDFRKVPKEKLKTVLRFSVEEV